MLSFSGMATPTTSYADGRSAGGKISNRTRRRYNPYERPPPPPPQRSPNWFSGVIVPTSRKIASGAAKIIFSVFASDTESSSDEDDAYNSSDNDSSFGMDKLSPESGNFSKEPQLSVEKRETKHVIEQLIMQETFSREECERLVKIINSRVMENSDRNKRESLVLCDTPRDTLDPDSLELSNEAVMEARKWIREKKEGQSPVPGFESCGAYSDRLQNRESKAASPVDMAKAYMNARPPWASPSTEYNELRTLAARTAQLTRDGSGESYSPLKSSLASGSWNLQDEIRRVHSKATENMLHTHSSAKVDLSSSAPASRLTQKYVLGNRVVDRIGDDVLFTSPIGTKKVDGSADLFAGIGTKLGFSDFENRQAGSVDEASLCKDNTCVQEQKQAILNEDDSAVPVSQHLDGLDHISEHRTDENSNRRNGPTGNEVKNHAETQNTNGEKELEYHAETQNANGGVPPSQASLSPGGGINSEVDRHPTDGEAAKLTSSNNKNKKTSRDVNVEDKVEVVSEASVDVPVAYEKEAQSSQSHEEPSQGDWNQAEDTPDTISTPERSPKVKKQQMRTYSTRPIARGRKGRIVLRRQP